MSSPSPSSPGKLNLVPNVPEIIALKYPTGKICESRYSEEKQVFFSLVDGRSAYFSMGLAKSITDLQLGTREPFNICKRWNGSKQQAPRYDVWLTPQGEKDRAAQEMDAPIPAQDPPSELEQQLDASLAAIQARKRDAQFATRRPPVPETQGPVAVPQRAAAPPAMAAWGQALLSQTNALIDVYAEACLHADELGVPNAVVRTVMLSAFIGLQRKGGA